jgi:hypoxanthine phosphoribosyltransferase
MTPESSLPMEVLVSRTQLAERASSLARSISDDYRDADLPPILVGILKGSALFFADLLRALDIDVEVDFMSISSYSPGGQQSGIVRIVKDLECDITGRDVLIVEDIVDTGLTLNYLRKALGERLPASLRTVALLNKTARRIVPVPVEYTGFEVPDVFVVGYGLDFQGRYRNCPDILAVTDLPRLANDPLLLVDPLFDPNTTSSGC